MSVGSVIVDLRRRKVGGYGSRMSGENRRRKVDVLMKAQGGLCGRCDEPIDLGLEHPHPKAASIEHVLAKSLGGSNHITNLLVEHADCNEAGGNRPPSPHDREWQRVVHLYLQIHHPEMLENIP
jgi:5-methylcytosine-specific restriction endonuclease McrA